MIEPNPTIETTNIPIGEKSIPKNLDIKSNIFGKNPSKIKKIPISIQIKE